MRAPLAPRPGLTEPRPSPSLLATPRNASRGWLSNRKEDIMRHYEIVFLVHPDQSEQVPAMLERYKGMITAGGGTRASRRGLGPAPARVSHRQGPQGALRPDEHRDATRKPSPSSPARSVSATRCCGTSSCSMDEAVTEPSPMAKGEEEEGERRRDRAPPR